MKDTARQLDNLSYRVSKWSGKTTLPVVLPYDLKACQDIRDGCLIEWLQVAYKTNNHVVLPKVQRAAKTIASIALPMNIKWVIKLPRQSSLLSYRLASKTNDIFVMSSALLDNVLDCPTLSSFGLPFLFLSYPSMICLCKLCNCPT